MRKFLALLALIVSVFTLAACGNPHDASYSHKHSASMTGEWKQVNASSDGWMTASISSGSIQVNFTNHDSNSMFWLGSFDGSRQSSSKFKIVSLGNQNAMRWAITASSEKQKTFTVDHGVLSFEFSALDSSTTIRMTQIKVVKITPTPKRKVAKIPTYTTRPTTSHKPTVKKTVSPRKTTSVKK